RRLHRSPPRPGSPGAATGVLAVRRVCAVAALRGRLRGLAAHHERHRVAPGHHVAPSEAAGRYGAAEPPGLYRPEPGRARLPGGRCVLRGRCAAELHWRAGRTDDRSPAVHAPGRLGASLPAAPGLPGGDTQGRPVPLGEFLTHCVRPPRDTRWAASRSTSMAHDLFGYTIPSLLRGLGVLSAYLECVRQAVESGAFTEDGLLRARLAADMLPLGRQIQIACDNAKNGPARLAGHNAPRFGDDEKRLAQYRDRVENTIAYIRSFTPRDFDGSEVRMIDQAFRGANYAMPGGDYVRD